MKYCTNCGNELMMEVNFCNNCGFKIQGGTESEHNNREYNKVNEVNQNTTILRESTESTESAQPIKIESTDSFLTKLKKEIFMQPTSEGELKMDATTAQILHIISWVCFGLALFTVFELVFSIIGYFLARTAMKSGVNANAARWANLVLSTIYLIILIISFIIGFIIGLMATFY